MNWDKIYRFTPLLLIPWHSNRPPALIVKAVKDLKPGKALDVCSGAGTNSIYLAKRGFEVLAIDISKTAIKIAQKRAEKENVKIDFRIDNVLNLKDRGKYNLIFDRGCFHHISKQDRERFIKIIHRALKENGKYLLLAFSERNNFEKSLSKEEIKNLFSPYFKINRISEEVHQEPFKFKVYLYAIAMTKRAN